MNIHWSVTTAGLLLLLSRYAAALNVLQSIPLVYNWKTQWARPGIPNESRFGLFQGSAWPEKFHSVYVMNGNYLLTDPFVNRISNQFCGDMVNLIMYLHVFQDRLVKNTK